MTRTARSAAERLGVEHHRLDVTDDASVAHLTTRPGRPDVPVDNAAIPCDTWQRASSADPGVVREAVETNSYGPWRMVRALLPLLRAARRAAGGAGRGERGVGGDVARRRADRRVLPRREAGSPVARRGTPPA